MRVARLRCVGSCIVGIFIVAIVVRLGVDGAGCRIALLVVCFGDVVERVDAENKMGLGTPHGVHGKRLRQLASEKRHIKEQLAHLPTARHIFALLLVEVGSDIVELVCRIACQFAVEKHACGNRLAQQVVGSFQLNAQYSTQNNIVHVGCGGFFAFGRNTLVNLFALSAAAAAAAALFGLDSIVVNVGTDHGQKVPDRWEVDGDIAPKLGADGIRVSALCEFGGLWDTRREQGDAIARICVLRGKRDRRSFRVLRRKRKSHACCGHV